MLNRVLNQVEYKLNMMIPEAFFQDLMVILLLFTAVYSKEPDKLNIWVQSLWGWEPQEDYEKEYDLSCGVATSPTGVRIQCALNGYSPAQALVNSTLGGIVPATVMARVFPGSPEYYRPFPLKEALGLPGVEAEIVKET